MWADTPHWDFLSELCVYQTSAKAPKKVTHSLKLLVLTLTGDHKLLTVGTMD